MNDAAARKAVDNAVSVSMNVVGHYIKTWEWQGECTENARNEENNQGFL